MFVTVPTEISLSLLLQGEIILNHDNKQVIPAQIKNSLSLSIFTDTQLFSVTPLKLV